MRKTLLALLCAAAAATAQSVRVTDCEATPLPGRELLLRGAVEATDAPRLWVRVYFQIVRGDGQRLDPAVLVSWGDLFTPDAPSGAVRWDDCSMVLPFEKIEAATNLPRGERVPLQVVCDLWGLTEQRWLADGWKLTCPLFVDIDTEGRIRSWESFHGEPFEPARCNPLSSKPGRALALDLKHLQLRKGVETARCVGEKHARYDLLTSADGRQAELRSTDRGHFFEPPATIEAARELVLLAHAGERIVPDRAAYVALRTAHEKRREEVAPKTFGIRAEAVATFGWRVGLLVVTNGEVWQYDYNVLRDGRLSRRATRCLMGWFIEPDPQAHIVPLATRLLDQGVRVPAMVTEVDGYLEPADWPETDE